MEVVLDDLGWVGIDPANGICPTDRYVRLASGLDADLTAPVKGSVTGGSDVTLDANVQISQAQQ